MVSARVTKAAAIQPSTPEEKLKKSLHPLRLAAMDKENLVGAGRILQSTDSINNKMTPKMKGDIKKSVDKDTTKKISDKTKTDSKKDGKRKGRILKDRAVQTEFAEKSKISSEELTSKGYPNENYWEILAERRGKALQKTLMENQMLVEQLKVNKEMLDESRALVEVLQEIIGEDGNYINNSLDDSRC